MLRSISGLKQCPPPHKNFISIIQSYTFLKALRGQTTQSNLYKIGLAGQRTVSRKAIASSCAKVFSLLWKWKRHWNIQRPVQKIFNRWKVYCGFFLSKLCQINLMTLHKELRSTWSRLSIAQEFDTAHQVIGWVYSTNRSIQYPRSRTSSGSHLRAARTTGY